MLFKGLSREKCLQPFPDALTVASNLTSKLDLALNNQNSSSTYFDQFFTEDVTLFTPNAGIIRGQNSTHQRCLKYPMF